MSTKLEVAKRFDAIVVAVGSFDKILVLLYNGMDGWKERWPAHLTHAKFHRTPKPCVGTASIHGIDSSVWRPKANNK